MIIGTEVIIIADSRLAAFQEVLIIPSLLKKSNLLNKYCLAAFTT